MGKTHFSMMAMLSVSGVAGLLFTGAGCGSSGGSGGTGGTGGTHDAGGGAGGSGGTGGAGGTHDAAVGDAATDAALSTINFTFDTSTQGFLIDNNAATNPVNLGAGSVDGGSGPTLSFDSTTGMPTAGSLNLDVTFTDYSQVVMVKLDYQLGSLQNLAGKTLTAQIRLDGPATPTDGGSSGDAAAGDAAAGDGGGSTTTSSSFTGVAHLFVLTTPVPVPPATGSYFFAQGTSINLLDHNWHAMTFDMSHPEYMAAGYDPTQIVQIGVQLASPGAPAADAGAPPFGAAQALSIHFDTLVSN